VEHLETRLALSTVAGAAPLSVPSLAAAQTAVADAATSYSGTLAANYNPAASHPSDYVYSYTITNAPLGSLGTFNSGFITVSVTSLTPSGTDPIRVTFELKNASGTITGTGTGTFTPVVQGGKIIDFKVTISHGSFTGGTGRYANITGLFTYSGTATPSKSVSGNVLGTYAL
jgi:hypothetical protein